MSTSLVGLLMTFAVYAFVIIIGFVIMVFMPKTPVGRRAATILTWLPPFIGGETLCNWAATLAEKLTMKRLAGKRTAETAERLAAEVEDAAMHVMLPMAESEQLGRIVACPDTGQGLVGVTAPEALAIAAYLRKNVAKDELRQIHEMAVENAKTMASKALREDDAPLPCPLHGANHVCCAYAARPLRCRVLHAVSVARTMPGSKQMSVNTQTGAPDVQQYEQTVAEGIELGVTRALKSAGLNADVYELNNALSTALETPDAAERWARGEEVFHTPLRVGNRR